MIAVDEKGRISDFDKLLALICYERGGKVVTTVDASICTDRCMLCCPYCHNPDLLEGGETVKTSDVLQKIDESLDFIDSLVVTGGEPLMQYGEVLKIIKHGKSRGLKVKLDTNGCLTPRLREVLEWVDYVALDVKAPFNKYKDVIGDDIGQNVHETR